MTGIIGSNGGSSIFSYRAVASTGQTATGSSLPLFVALTPNTPATITLYATNVAGESAASQPSNSVTALAAPIITEPSVPTFVVAAAGPRSITVTVGDPETNGNSPITSVTVRLSTGETKTQPTGPVTFTNLDETPRVAFAYYTNAVGKSTEAGPSNTVVPDQPSTEPIIVNVFPKTSVVQSRGNQQFTAVVSGPDNPSQQVTWETNEGTISSSGFFTAPAATVITQMVSVKATSVTDPTASDTVIVTIPASSDTGITDPDAVPMRHYAHNITNRFGAAVEGASVTVTNSDNGQKAVLWADKAKTKEIYNPLITDENGYFEFYVEAFQCSYTVRGNGIMPYTRKDIFDVIYPVNLSSILQALENLNSTKVSITQLNEIVETLAPLSALDVMQTQLNELRLRVEQLENT